MSWVRVDDSAPNHPKMIRAGAEAAWLWLAAVAYSNAHKLDGRIGKDLLPAVYSPLAPRALKLAARLVEVGLLHDRGDHFEIHDYQKYQEQALKESVEARREYERNRKRAQRHKAPVSGNVPADCPGLVPDISGDTAGAVPSVTRARAQDGPGRDRDIEDQQDGSPRAREGESSGVRAVFGWASALKAFDDAWSEATGITLGLHSGHQREGERLLGCVERQAKADGIEPTEVVRRLVLGASRDEFCRKARAPLSAALKSFGTLYAAGSGRDPAKAQNPDERPPYGTPEYREWVRKNNAEVLRVMGKAPKEASG